MPTATTRAVSRTRVEDRTICGRMASAAATTAAAAGTSVHPRAPATAMSVHATAAPRYEAACAACG
jgi:hypothetical protein